MNLKNNTVNLCIADCIITLTSDEGVHLDDGCKPFVLGSDGYTESIAVECNSRLENAPKCTGESLYQAKDENGKLWEIFDAAEGILIHVYSPEAPYALQQVCAVSENYSSWHVWSNPNADNLLDPLAYPLGPLIMYHLTLIEDVIMIHASGVAMNGKASIFTGVSGKGKTTMARLWFEAGADVLNDDRLIIRKEKDGYSVHNTPMFYEDTPRSASLKAIHIIRHAKKNVAEQLLGAEAIASVSANCIQHGYRGESVQKHLNFLSELVSKIPVYDVGFLPERSIVDYLQKTHATI
jgi:hypothetical protein